MKRITFSSLLVLCIIVSTSVAHAAVMQQQIPAGEGSVKSSVQFPEPQRALVEVVRKTCNRSDSIVVRKWDTAQTQWGTGRQLRVCDAKYDDLLTSVPAVAADHHGRMAVFWGQQNILYPKRSGIWMSASTNNGKKWSKAKLVLPVKDIIGSSSISIKAAVSYSRYMVLWNANTTNGDAVLHLDAVSLSGRNLGSRLTTANSRDFRAKPADSDALNIAQTRYGLVSFWWHTDAGGQGHWYSTTRIKTDTQGKHINIRFGVNKSIPGKPGQARFVAGYDRGFYAVTVAQPNPQTNDQAIYAGRWDGKKFVMHPFGTTYPVGSSTGSSLVGLPSVDSKGVLRVAYQSNRLVPKTRPDCNTLFGLVCYRSVGTDSAPAGIFVAVGGANGTTASNIPWSWPLAPEAARNNSTIVEWYEPSMLGDGVLLDSAGQPHLSYTESYQNNASSGSVANGEKMLVTSDGL